jgi:hypothetical protein
MFKILDFHRKDGKIRMVIETDDSSSVLFFQFISDIQKFIETYYFLQRSASQIDLSQKNRPLKLEQASLARRKQLQLFRELEGSRYQRLRVLKELRAIHGENVTIDRLSAQIQYAIEEEKVHLIDKVNELSKKGYSSQQISKEIGIPKSTVSRYLKLASPTPKKKVSPLPSRVLPLRKRKN